MQSQTMLYVAPGPHEIHGGRFDYIIVNDDEIEQHLADGWHLTTTEAKAAHDEEQARAAAAAAGDGPSDGAPATRAELEAKATELGIEFSPNIGDKKLGERIAAALAKG
ncbi:hypothetical protein [Massilia sp. ZL223]|uniref:hypothetical protein n=1 Tax=Massilia sp. ZL223 TaxID=2824904 RepID=UPI001B82AFE6|nr:hypothetical protein [Massilia sp. ZL223]MBQ5963148.1 hypothetical protein [Massilia sp. ZL223]